LRQNLGQLETLWKNFQPHLWNFGGAFLHIFDSIVTNGRHFEKIRNFEKWKLSKMCPKNVLESLGHFETLYHTDFPSQSFWHFSFLSFSQHFTHRKFELDPASYSPNEAPKLSCRNSLPELKFCLGKIAWKLFQI